MKQILQSHIKTRQDITSYGMMGSFREYHSRKHLKTQTVCLRRVYAVNEKQRPTLKRKSL